MEGADLIKLLWVGPPGYDCIIQGNDYLYSFR